MSNILDTFRLDNKIALVTGSAGGMGAAIAIALAEAGATIATHDIRPPADTVATIEAAGGKAWDPLESTCRHASLSIL